MRLPKRVSIMGVDFDVKEVNKLDSYGECAGGERVIRVRKNLRPDLKLSTFAHECLHAIFYVSGHTAKLDGIDDVGGAEESLVLALESGLMPLIPKLAALAAEIKPDETGEEN